MGTPVARLGYQGSFDPGYAFQGQARQFLARVRRTDLASKAANGALRETLKRRRPGKVPTTDFLIALERAWARMPASDSVLCRIQRERGRLSIRDLRIAPCELVHGEDHNGPPEVGLLLAVCHLTIARGVEELGVREQAFVGFHALARWYQRSFDQSDASLMNDVSRLFVKRLTILATDAEEFVVEAGSGSWRGEICEGTDSNQPILRVATFHGFGTRRP